jgi:type IV pilus assembly protein PilY1
LDAGERQNVPSALIGGVLIVPTLVPPTGLCDISGKGWINVFDYKSGSAVDPSASFVVSTQTTSPIAGLYYTYSTPVPGDPLTVTIGADFTRATTKNDDCDNSDPNCNKVTIPGGGIFQARRAIWRELITE